MTEENDLKSKPMPGKRVLLGIVIVVLTFGIFWGMRFGLESLWQLWNMPHIPQTFADSLTITSAAESHALGHDPLFENVTDPQGRQLNYPRIWHSLFWLPIDKGHTWIFASVFLLSFFVGIFLFLKPIDTQTALFLGLMVFSPASIFGLQLGNNELFIFFLVALALRLGYRSIQWGAVVMFLASVLKLVPIFGLVQLLGAKKRVFWKWILPLGALFFVYFVASFDDFRQIQDVTPKGRGGAFGVFILPSMIEKVLSRWTAFPLWRERMIAWAPVFFYAIAFFILVFSLHFSVAKGNRFRPTLGRHISAFRVGACIYIGSFLMASNWNYRMIFLIFTIPQLVVWLSDRDIWFSRVVRATLVCILFSAWSMFTRRVLGSYLNFTLDEIANWIAFSGLTYLFWASLPNWALNYFSRLRLFSTQRP